MRRCCYCSFELQSHQWTFDAEHILDKDTYPEYMFELANIAAACKLCNGAKSNKSISSSGDRFYEISYQSHDYSIVHPHLDEWHVHLTIDGIGRIWPVQNSAKGARTIEVCGISGLNAIRLADKFSVKERAQVERFLRRFMETGDVLKKRKLLEFLEVLAGKHNHAGAKTVTDWLRRDLEVMDESGSG
jgi:hypothetical protein